MVEPIPLKPNDPWARAKDILLRSVGQETYTRWMHSLQLKSVGENGEVILTTTCGRIRNHLQTQHRQAIEAACAVIFGRSCTVRITIRTAVKKRSSVVVSLPSVTPGLPRQRLQLVGGTARPLVAYNSLPRATQIAARPYGTRLSAQEQCDVVVGVVATHFNTSVATLLSIPTPTEFQISRDVAVYVTHRVTRMPLHELGLYFGKRAEWLLEYSIRNVVTSMQTGQITYSETHTLCQRAQAVLAERCSL